MRTLRQAVDDYLELRCGLGFKLVKPVAVFKAVRQPRVDQDWVREAISDAKSLGLAALVWFEVNKELDWRLENAVPEAVRVRINEQNSAAPSASSLLGRQE